MPFAQMFEGVSDNTGNSTKVCVYAWWKFACVR